MILLKPKLTRQSSDSQQLWLFQTLHLRVHKPCIMKIVTLPHQSSDRQSHKTKIVTFCWRTINHYCHVNTQNIIHSSQTITIVSKVKQILLQQVHLKGKWKMFARENVSLFLDKIRFLKDFQRLLVLYYKIHQSKDSAP